MIAPLLFVLTIAVSQRADTAIKVAGPPRYAQPATMVEELSIGVVDGADEYMFEGVNGIAIAKDESIYVLDRAQRLVRMYDAKGTYLRTIGRRGRGPGEIEVASAIATHPDGRLLLWDTQNWRVNVYSAQGAVLTHWSVLSRGASLVGNGLTVDTAGVVYAERLLTPPPDVQPRAFWYAWLRLRSDNGTVLDTVFAPNRWPPRPAGLAGRTAKVSMPFTAEPVARVSPLGYLVTGVGNTYAFELRHANGSVTSIRRNVSAEPVTAAEREAERKRVQDYIRRSDPSWTWGSRDVPKTKPFYMDFFVGLDGRIWVQRDKRTAYPPPATNANGGIGGAPLSAERAAPRPTSRGGSAAARTMLPTRFDVFEPSGEFIGQAIAPAGIVPLIARGTQVWGYAVDADGVEIVKRLRVNWR